MNKRFRALIVDDERLARLDLRKLLEPYNDTIEIVGEADSVQSALDRIAEHDPNLIFLDIQMPGETGFDLLENGDISAGVIFVTAFDEYAIKAFEVEAVDYLLKPVNPERLKRSLERLEHETPAFDNGPRKKLGIDDALFISINNRLKFLRVCSIVAIRAAGDYSEVVFQEGKKGLAVKSMSEWEERLPEKYFCRIHRSTIVNMQYVTHLEESVNGSYLVHWKGSDAPFPMSRRYATLLKQRMG